MQHLKELREETSAERVFKKEKENSEPMDLKVKGEQKELDLKD
ncbi:MULTISPECIES: hypothetical protein [unclassified Methanosarcina]|nr:MULTISPECIES: hypothetical protein [unclassified Methanosarcina]